MSTDLTTAVLTYCAELECDRPAADRPEVAGGDDAELAFDKEEWEISQYATFLERDRAEGTPIRVCIMISPGASSPGDATLTYAPIVRLGDDGALRVRLGRLSDAAWAVDAEEQFYNPWQRVREVARLHARGLVVLDAEGDVFLMTEEEYASQV